MPSGGKASLGEPPDADISMTNCARPSLDAANARVSRARDHIHELQRRTRATLRARKSNMFVSGGRESSGVCEDSTHSDSVPANEPLPVDPTISILVGEVAYNLRAALDYLVYELSIVDSPRQEPTMTQFPICSSPGSWERSRRTRIRLLSDAHVTDIKKLQPATGAGGRRCSGTSPTLTNTSD
jgi:hypothetical protein